LKLEVIGISKLKSRALVPFSHSKMGEEGPHTPPTLDLLLLLLHMSA
jgi:hypothetical protein